MKALPLKNERKPIHPVPRVQPPASFPYKVRDRETWISVARYFDLQPEYLIYFNFYVYLDVKHPKATDEVNWYLREYVGCNVTTDGGRNWAFSSSANPGIIYIRQKTMDFEGDGSVILGSTGVGEVISVPQYDDSNIIDTISKGLDIYGAVDMGIGVSEVALPAAVEAGMIPLGVATAAVGPLVAIGAPYGDILKDLSRKYFFEGYSIGLVMSANGASRQYTRDHGKLNYAPQVVGFQEKAETYRKMHNDGLELGIRQGEKLNSVDKKNLFVFLHSQFSASEQQTFTPKTPWSEWNDAKRKAYYDLTSGIIKQTMLKNNLRLKIK